MRYFFRAKTPRTPAAPPAICRRGAKQIRLLVDARNDVVGRAAHQRAGGARRLPAAAPRFSRAAIGAVVSTSGGRDHGIDQPAFQRRRRRRAARPSPAARTRGDDPSAAAPAGSRRLPARARACTNGVENRASRAGDHIIAMQQHGGADADRDALHGGDQRLLAARERMQKSGSPARPGRRHARPRPSRKSCQIVAGAERARHARDQDAADLRDRRRRAPRAMRVDTSRRSARSSCPAGSCGSCGPRRRP